MKPESSNSLIDRIIAWLRGLFAAGTGGSRRTADGSGSRAGETRASDNRAGERGATDRTPATDEAVTQRSDFDDAAGERQLGDEPSPRGTSLVDSATHIHDAVGGDDEAANERTDGIIDTTRDAARMADRRGDSLDERRRDVPGVSTQDEIIAFEGASTDEVSVGGFEPEQVSREDVESAAEEYGEQPADDLANTTESGTSELSGSTFTETDIQVEPGDVDTGSGDDVAPPDDAGSFHVVEKYNYGLGDLGVGEGPTPDDAWSAGDDRDGSSETEEPPAFRVVDGSADPSAAGGDPNVNADASEAATREEIESASEGDAVNRSDEATQTPGFGGPESFANAETGTTTPSRSATGNELDETQDALGTTLTDDVETADAFDADAANLSSEDELAMSEELDSGDQQASEATDRVATFQSGTIAHEGVFDEEVAYESAGAGADPFAELPDTPQPESADDTGFDDFSGSDYPSDRRVDALAGDDPFDAQTPDADEAGSSAGDLDTTPPADDTLIADVSGLTGTDGGSGRQIDQDAVGTSDEHVGGEEPDFAESASRGTDETGVDDGTGAGREDVPAGAVRSAGGTEAPAGYPVKGNASSMIYHLPGYPSYASTKAEYCFATEDDAIAAGYRAPGRRNRGKKS